MLTSALGALSFDSADGPRMLADARAVCGWAPEGPACGLFGARGCADDAVVSKLRLKGASAADRGAVVMETLRQEVASCGSEDPFYVVDLGEVRRLHRRWVSLFPRVDPFYAIKCNPDTEVIRTLGEVGCGFDCASAPEIHAVLQHALGGSSLAAASRIIYANPAKHPSHLLYAREAGVRLVTLDSADELHKLAALFPEAGCVIRLLVDDSHARCRLGAKFGAPPDTVAHLVRTVRKLGLRLEGFSFHVGSGATSAVAYALALETARRAFDLAESEGLSPRLLDIGGGFSGRLAMEGWESCEAAGGTEATVATDEEGGVPLWEVAAVVNPLLEQYFPESEGVRVIAEPGRYFVETSHTLATAVVGRRVVPPHGHVNGADTASAEPHVMYYLSDGLYGAFNCLVFDHVCLRAEVVEGAYTPLRAWGAAASEAGGPSCESSPALEVGDGAVSPTVLELPGASGVGAADLAVEAALSAWISVDGSQADEVRTASPSPSTSSVDVLEGPAAASAPASGSGSSCTDGPVAGGESWRTWLSECSGASAPPDVCGPLWASTLYGPTCDGIDCVARGIRLPALQVGHWVAWRNMGAYTAAAASNFNGFPKSRKVYVDTDA